MDGGPMEYLIFTSIDFNREKKRRRKTNARIFIDVKCAAFFFETIRSLIGYYNKSSLLVLNSNHHLYIMLYKQMRYRKISIITDFISSKENETVRRNSNNNNKNTSHIKFE